MTDPDLLESADAFVPVLMDLDVEKLWATRHNVTLHPCIVFTDAEGEVWGAALEMETGAEAIAERMRDTLAVMAELGADEG